MAQGHSIDEYLETIYFLAFPIGEYTPRGAGTPPLASRVAEMLHVSRASAGEMLKRLEAEGLIERGARKEALLTKTGRERAEHVVRKHRLIERLLTDFMGYTGARGARESRRARRHLRRRHDRPDRREARPPRPLPARLARRPRRRAGGERAPRPARSAHARDARHDHPARRARRRAAPLVLRPRARPRDGARGDVRGACGRRVRDPAERRQPVDLRAGRRRPLRPRRS